MSTYGEVIEVIWFDYHASHGTHSIDSSNVEL